MVLIILLSNVFIAFLGIGLVIPVMPSFMEIMHLSGKTMGSLVAVFTMAQLVMSPLAGRWVDRYGRKIMIILGMVLFGVSELIFGLGTHVAVLYFSRMIGGFSAAFIMPAVTAYFADVTTVEERPKAMGYLSAAISTGFIIGTGIGGFLAEYGVRTPFYFADPLYAIAFILVFVLAFGLSAYETIFRLFTAHKFGFTPGDIAAIITISSLFGVVVQIFLFGKMVQRLGEKKLIQICLIAGAILAAASVVISGFWAVLALTCFIFLAFDLLRPALTTFLSRSAGNEQGFVAGMNSTYTSLGNIVGPATGGILFDVNIHYPYGFSAVIMAIGLGITAVWQGREATSK
ncbi:MFS transporter [Cohnella zeiphila]|uniref:MFS transporter n=1 Tax=Cohnella zeiphila TaxID=2761120 RepID=A0A7X0SG92_9BACL|nr:MFS transporter [Cohnella zeiphila]MBB6729425.1 MFS transporter [Cohnella zeiphila]